MRKLITTLLITFFLSGAALANSYANFTVSNQRVAFSAQQEVFDVLNVNLVLGGTFSYHYVLDSDPVFALAYAAVSYRADTWLVTLEATTRKEISISYGIFW